MKNVIAMIFAVLLAVTSVSADGVQLPHISVYGTAVTEVVPDEMIWSLKIENKGGDLEAVAREHGKQVEAVLKFLKESKVDEKSLQTSGMRFGENWEYRGSSRVKEGYVASTDIAFKMRELDKYSALWLGLAKSTAVTVESVNYEHTKRIEYRNETRQKALLAAKEKASVMAATLGAEIGEPLAVEEDMAVSEGWQGNYARNTSNVVRSLNADDEISSEGLSPGTISIKARVRISFRLMTTRN